jgi:hypothetical protein
MNSWINLTAIWEIVVLGLLAGAGLPALFAIGLVALGMTRRGHRTTTADALVGGNPAGIAIAVGCLAVVVAAIAYGIYIIVLSGHK